MTFAALVLSLLLTPSARAAGSSAAAGACRPQTVAKHARLKFPSGKRLVVDIVDTPETREIGLMCRRKLPRDYGMLFVFADEALLNFWMKNTLVSLDIVWIGADKRITVVHPNLKASTVSTPDDKVVRAAGRGQYVLELPAGAARRLRLHEGDALKFEVSIPKS